MSARSTKAARPAAGLTGGDPVLGRAAAAPVVLVLGGGLDAD
jgi:hypothetical protein